MSQLIVDNKSGISHKDPQREFYANLFEQHYMEIMVGDFSEVSNIVIEALHLIEGRDQNENLISPACERLLVNLFIYNRITSPEQRNAAIELFRDRPEEIFFKTSNLFLYAQAADVELDRGEYGMKGVWDRKLERSLYSGDASPIVKAVESILLGLGYGLPDLYRIIDSFENLTGDVVSVDETCDKSGERGILKRLNEKLEIKCDNLLRGIRSRARKEGKSVIEILEAINGNGLSWT